MVGGMGIVRGRLRVEAQGRLLTLHSAAGDRERGVGVTLGVGNPSQEGLVRCRCRLGGADAAHGRRDAVAGAGPSPLPAGCGG